MPCSKLLKPDLNPDTRYFSEVVALFARFGFFLPRRGPYWAAPRTV